MRNQSTTVFQFHQTASVCPGRRWAFLTLPFFSQPFDLQFHFPLAKNHMFDPAWGPPAAISPSGFECDGFHDQAFALYVFVCVFVFVCVCVCVGGELA